MTAGSLTNPPYLMHYAAGTTVIRRVRDEIDARAVLEAGLSGLRTHGTAGHRNGGSVMGLWSRYRDKRTGTKYPESGVEPLPVMELRAALLALNDTGVPFRVRNALPEEKAALVAEWQVPELKMTLKTRMRFVPEKGEVRTLDERWDKSPETGGRRYSRGPTTTVSRRWTYERGPDGRRRKIETLRFDSRDMRNPLQKIVLSSGWTWRGVLSRW